MAHDVKVIRPGLLTMMSCTVQLMLCVLTELTHSQSPFDCRFYKHKLLFVSIYSMFDFLMFLVLKGFKVTAQNIIWSYIKIFVKKLAQGEHG